jgi:hypothetical protein
MRRPLRLAAQQPRKIPPVLPRLTAGNRRSEAENLQIVITLVGIIEQRDVSRLGVAAGAAKEQHQPFVAGQFVTYGAQKALAGVGAIAGIDVDVLAVQAAWAMIATGPPGRWNFGTAVFTKKAFVDFLEFAKRGLGHEFLPSVRPWLNGPQLSAGSADGPCRKAVGTDLIVEGRVLSKRNLSQMLLAVLLLGCANGSSDSGSAAATSPSGETIKGSIKSVTGSQSEMNQWILALVERDTGISHSGVINAIGNYTIEGVDTSVPYTLVLLDPQYRFSAILTYAGVNPGTIRQYFAIGENRLPTLVHNGPIINFTDFSSIAWEKNEAADANGNLIPDVMEASAGLVTPGLAGTATTVDTDGDGLTNDVDGDIDGDGLPNWFDPDDDNDGIPDAFDTDANADEVADLSQDIGDQYFPRLVKFLALQLVQDVQSDGSLASTLMFTVRLWEDEVATSVLVKGSSTLFAGASAVQYDPNTGDAALSSWDQTLLDDGNNEDGEAGDGIFTRRVQLASTAVPKANQVFFMEVTQGSGDTRMVHEFPFTFPSMVTGVITGAYTSETRKVTMTGSPFGTVTDFHWSVHVYDANGIKVFASEPIAGSSTSYTLPTGATDEGETYTARIVATAIDRIPSFPSWVMRSASFNLQ